jgi:hypothetical protein
MTTFLEVTFSPPTRNSWVDPRISKDRNTSMPGHLFQDTNDANIQVAWMQASIVDSLQNIPIVYRAAIYGHILIASSKLKVL